MRPLPVLLSLLLLTADAVAAQPQFLPPLPAGARVRIVQKADGASPRVGRVLETAGDTLILQMAFQAGPRRVPLDDLERLDLSVGRRRHGRRGATVGALAGSVAGALLGAAALEECDRATTICPRDLCSREWLCPLAWSERIVPLWTGAVGAVAGAALGWGVGSLVRTDSWAALVADSGGSAALGIVRDGRGARLSVEVPTR